MHPVKLTITGDWWDAYIYASRLYLVRMDGTVVLVPWPRLIRMLIERYKLDELAAELAFVDARYLYGDQWARLVQDGEIRQVLDAKFARLAAEDLSVSDIDLQRCGATDLGHAAPELSADFEVHRSIAYFGAENGLWTQHVARLGKQRPAERIWDCPLFRVRASHGVVALAAGSAGLFQAPAQWGPPTALTDADPVVYGDFFSCGWLATNIYASSYFNAGTLAIFRERRARRERVVHRVFEGAVPDQVLFDASRRAQEVSFDRTPSRPEVDSEEAIVTGTSGQRDGPEIVFERRQPPPAADPHSAGLSWGGQDRVCQVSGSDVRVAMYAPRSRYFADRFRPMPSLTLERSQEAVAGDVAPFGVIVETTTDLFVLAEEGVWRLGYEPARWRCFSRATNYPNHLHVVGEHGVDVYSFLTIALQELRRRTTPQGRFSRLT
jgi:hypothetical protein